MLELNGKYNVAKIFTDKVDNATIGQVTALLNQKSVKNSKIRIMPDTHAGAGCVIGTTMTITDKVIPNLVGVDIGCGMTVVGLKEKRLDLPKLDSYIRKEIPAGFEIRKTIHKYMDNTNIQELYALKSKAVNIERAELSLGTLGGGNHFIEVDKDNEGKLYLVIHTGSRNLGKQVAEFYQKKAWESQKNSDEDILHELAYCEGKLFEMYIHDMKITQEYAYWNREAIADTIIKGMKLHEVERFHTVHNYIDTESMILRKGSVSACSGEKLLIPINMRDGSLICIGKGNADWNYSAPHGAGRLMSRNEAKNNITLSEFKKTMKKAGVYSTSISKDTIDESPMAYKSMGEIIDNIKDTVEIIEIIRPVYNFKAGGE